MPLDVDLVTSMLHNDAVRHLIGVASYAETPLGVSKWLESNMRYVGKPALG